jgi:V-type H+-transporting ATPase subunit d
MSAFFNSDYGFSESVCRGSAASWLTASDYSQLVQCETLEDMNQTLASSDISRYVAKVVPAGARLTPPLLRRALAASLKDSFGQMRAHASGKLASFLDLLCHPFMIDNVVLILVGTLHGSSLDDILPEAHPLGLFDGIEALCAVRSVDDLYATVLAESPLADYFLTEFQSIAELSERNVELLRAQLYRAWLEAFHAFSMTCPGDSPEVMGELLTLEADRACISLVLRTLPQAGREATLSIADRKQLLPRVGILFPAYADLMLAAADADAIRSIVDAFEEYRAPLAAAAGDGNATALDAAFFQQELDVYRSTFMRQCNFGVFYAWLRMAEQEARNVLMIAECIVSGNRALAASSFIPLF